MHSLIHIEYARAVRRDGPDEPGARTRPPTLPPDAPPGRLRVGVAHVLGTAARRLAPEVARRAVE